MCLDETCRGFKPSNGWLGRFKKRHNIEWKKMSGEKASVDLDSANHWVDNVLPKLVDGYSSDCVYNADETGLFYRMKPEYTMENSRSKAGGCKKSKERLTFLFCSNADGTEKSLPLVIC